jgi:cell division protein ZapA (FtsZ GTPase activity inhibitor)
MCIEKINLYPINLQHDMMKKENFTLFRNSNLQENIRNSNFK